MFLKVSRLIVLMLSIFKLFQSIIVLGRKEYLYKSILDCSCANLKGLLARVYDIQGLAGVNNGLVAPVSFLQS